MTPLVYTTPSLLAIHASGDVVERLSGPEERERKTPQPMVTSTGSRSAVCIVPSNVRERPPNDSLSRSRRPARRELGSAGCDASRT